MFQDKDEHLELMDGMLVDLLNAKWNAFVKFRYSTHLLLKYFIVLNYIICSCSNKIYIHSLLHYSTPNLLM